MTNFSNSDRLVDCPNGYTKESIFDYFMEREEDSDVCKNCKNLSYRYGTMTCSLMDKIRKE